MSVYQEKYGIVRINPRGIWTDRPVLVEVQVTKGSVRTRLPLLPSLMTQLSSLQTAQIQNTEMPAPSPTPYQLSLPQNYTPHPPPKEKTVENIVKKKP